MTIIKKFVPICLSVFAFVAAGAQAGYHYEATTVNTGDGISGEQTTTVSAWSEGDSTRIEFKEGEKMGFFGPGSYLVSTDAGETLYLVNPADKTYALFDLGEVMNTAGKAMESLGGMMKMEITNPHFEKVSEEPGGQILGYNTQHVRFNSGYTISMSIMGQSMNQVVESQQELWVTPDVDPAALNAWLRPDKMMKGMFKGMSEMIEAQYSQIKGAPLKSIVSTKTEGGMGGSTNGVMTTQVTVLEKETIPAVTFAIPADFTKTDLMAEIAKEEGEPTDGPSLEESMSKLKGLFGG